VIQVYIYIYILVYSSTDFRLKIEVAFNLLLSSRVVCDTSNNKRVRIFFFFLNHKNLSQTYPFFNFNILVALKLMRISYWISSCVNRFIYI
jgi:hypothetical protein